MGQKRTFKFTSGGSAYNLDLGMAANKVSVVNFSAADTEVWKLESWLDLMGDNVEIWHYIQDNDGGDDVVTPVMKSSGGYLSTYDTSVVGQNVGVTFDDTGGASEDLVTATPSAGHGLSNGEKVRFRIGTSGVLPTNISATTDYYVIDATATTFRVSLTKGGSAVDFGSDGTAPNNVYSLDNLKVDSDGFKGITISGSFMADGDVIYVEAEQTDRSTDLGDIG